MVNIEIIIPAYNCRETLSRTLASLEAQTDNNFSVHVVDDCSKEDLNDIIKYHNKLNIRVTRNKKNLGCGMSRQVGIDSTNADYIAFVDSDDVLMPYTVETWRGMAESSLDTDIFHSYFYEQNIIDGNPALIPHNNGFTWCHGKLYKVDFIRKWDIKNNPEVKYADDSFFNSMCTELGKMSIIPIPMYMWLNNKNSITRCGTNLFGIEKYQDFIHAMLLSIEFLKSKNVTKVEHLQYTVKKLEKAEHLFDTATKEEYIKLKEYLGDLT